MNLLDEINTMPTASAAKIHAVPTQVNHVPEAMQLPSSDLFDEVDAVVASVVASPLATIFTRSRPVVGESPMDYDFAPVQSVQEDCLPFPIAPEMFTPELFLSNLRAIKFDDVDTDLRAPMLNLPAFDRTLKVPLVIGIVTAIDQPSGRDYLVRLSDDSGTYSATIHELAVRESGKKLHYGMMAVLRDLTIYRPSNKAECLIVVPRNVVKFISNVHQVNL